MSVHRLVKHLQGQHDQKRHAGSRGLQITPIGRGKNAAQLVTFTDKSKGVWKPRVKSRLWESDGEIAASKVSDMLGLNVPRTVEFELGERQGTLQDYVEGSRELTDDEYYGDEIYQTPGGLKIGILDYITQQGDRRVGNIRVARGQPIPIDNGRLFKNPYAPSRASYYTELNASRGLPPNMLKGWDSVSKHEFQKVFAYDGADPEGAWERFEELRSTGKIPL